MDFRILGPVEVVSGGQPVPLTGQRQRALLVYLLLHRNEVVSAERLVNKLWTAPPRGGLAALQTQVSRLRKLVGDRIQTTGAGYTMRVEPGELDLDRFRGLLADAGMAARPDQRSRLFRDAARLWRGEPLAGIDAPFAELEAAALEELRLGALEERIDAELACGLHADLVAELGGLVAEHPLRERLRGQLILALYRCGRQADALEEYRQTRRMFVEELGLEPGPALKELERAILRHDPALASREIRRAPDAPPEPIRRRTAYAALLVTALAAGIGAAFALTHSGSDKAKQIRAAASVAAKPQHRSREARVIRRAPRRGLVRPTATAGPTTVFVRVVTETTSAATAVAGPPTVAAHPTPAVSVPTTLKTAPVETATTPGQTLTVGNPNPVYWTASSEGTGPTAVEQDGTLQLTLPASSIPDARGALSAAESPRCRLDGDFDARVGYQLLEWPAANGTSVGLVSSISPRPIGSANRASSSSSETYYGVVGAYSTSVRTVDSNGSLRLARKNGVETAYYAAAGKWVAIESRFAPGGATITLQLYANGEAFAHQEVRVVFTNFSLTAGGDSYCTS